MSATLQSRIPASAVSAERGPVRHQSLCLDIAAWRWSHPSASGAQALHVLRHAPARGRSRALPPAHGLLRHAGRSRGAAGRRARRLSGRMGRTGAEQRRAAARANPCDGRGSAPVGPSGGRGSCSKGCGPGAGCRATGARTSGCPPRQSLHARPCRGRRYLGNAGQDVERARCARAAQRRLAEEPGSLRRQLSRRRPLPCRGGSACAARTSKAVRDTDAGRRRWSFSRPTREFRVVSPPVAAPPGPLAAPRAAAAPKPVLCRSPLCQGLPRACRRRTMRRRTRGRQCPPRHAGRHADPAPTSSSMRQTQCAAVLRRAAGVVGHADRRATACRTWPSSMPTRCTTWKAVARAAAGTGCDWASSAIPTPPRRWRTTCVPTIRRSPWCRSPEGARSCGGQRVARLRPRLRRPR